MPIDITEPRILTGVINKRELKSDLFTSFFKKRPASNGQTFDLYVRSQETTMIPAVTLSASGVMRQQPGWGAQTVKAPRFRLKRAFMADQQFVVQFGQTPYAPLQDSARLAIAEMADLFNQEFDYAVEVMCAQALVDGKIKLYNMENSEKSKELIFEVDFKRPDAHNVVLSGDNMWSNTAVDVMRQIDDWRLMIQKETGIGADTMIMGRDAWAAFRKLVDVKELLDIKRMDLGQLSPRAQSAYRGNYYGVDIYVVPGLTYKDIDNTVKPYLADNRVVLIAKDAEARIEYGKPSDDDCHGPARRFMKQYKSEDPSGHFMVAESRPLPWPIWPGWVVVADVVAAKG